MKRRVNVRAVVVLLAGGVVLGIGVPLLHGFQVGRNAPALLKQALQAEQAGDPAQALDDYEFYLQLAPGDTNALVRYGSLLGRTAHTPRQLFRAFLVLNNALRRDGNRLDVRRQVAELALKLGRFSEAQQDLQTLRKTNPTDPEQMMLLGRCALGERDYGRAQKMFEMATQEAPERIDAWVQYAGLLRRLDKPAAADEAIERMVARNEGSVAARAAAARYFLDAGAGERAEPHVQAALQAPGPHDADLFLLAGEVARARGKRPEARAFLEQGLKQDPHHTGLNLELARLEFLDGHRAQALQALQSSLKDLPRQPQELWGLANLLIDLGKQGQVEAVLRRLKETGSAPLAKVLRGRLLMRQAAWGEARTMLEKARASLARSTALSGHVDLLLAECYGRLGNPDQQLSAYRAALQANPRSLPARHGLARTLAVLGKTEESVAEYRRLLPQAPQLGLELARLLVAKNGRLPAGRRNWQEVEGVLRQLPEAQSAASAVQLLLAQVLAAQGRLAEARKLAEAERDRDPRQVAPWLFLVGLAEREKRPEAILPLLDAAEKAAGRRVEWHLARASYWAGGDPAEARRQLGRLEAAQDELAPDERAPLLAGLAAASERIGDVAGAERLWRQVAERQPDDSLAQRALAAFYLRVDDKVKAEPCLRRLLDPKLHASEAVAGWARRTLAVALAWGGTYRQVREAESLLQTDAATADADAQVARALVLAVRPGRRAEAIRQLEGLPPQRIALAPDLQFLLARLYELTGDWRQARVQLVTLLSHQGQNPVYLSFYVQALVRHGQADEALEWLDLLDRIGIPATAKVELRAHVLHATGKSDEAVRLLREHARAPGARLDRVAYWLDRLGRPAEAEALYRQLAADSAAPTAVLHLAAHLGRQGKMAEAFDLCSKAWDKCSPEAVARASIALLRTGQATADQTRAVEDRLRQAIARHPQRTLLRLLLAEVNDLRGQANVADDQYRKILQQEPDNVVALNNLACHLSLQAGGRKEAARLIDRAIDLAGPHPELLDSRALVHLRAGRPGLAAEDLRQAVLDDPDPAKQFHLAQACAALDDTAGARKAYRRAVDGGMKPADFPPAERGVWLQMMAQYKGG